MNTVRRGSKKRQAIYEALCNTTAHPSAEQLYSQLKPSHSDLSLGTVYRNLGILIEDGLIVSIGKVNGEERYDARTGRHSHFICSSCGAVEDVMTDIINTDDFSEVEDSIGCKISTVCLSFTGQCKKCVS